MPYNSGYYTTSGTVDWVYLIILFALFIASMAASSAVQKRYKQYSAVRTSSGITGAEAARQILLANGVTSTQITMINGKDLSDYYDPKKDVICLSPNTFNNSSVAAVGVACHEAGHAIQYAKGYAPVKIRMACIPMSNVCSKIAIPLIFLGFILSIFSSALRVVALAGIILFAVAVFVQLVTLPVEFDASRRALSNIRNQNLLSGTEYDGAKSVLTAAAMTYVVAMLSSVVQLIRLLNMYNRRR